MNYKAIKNTDITQESKRGLTLREKRPTKYSVTLDDKIIVFIPDWYKDGEALANALAAVLNNNRKIVLPLEI